MEYKKTNPNVERALLASIGYTNDTTIMPYLRGFSPFHSQEENERFGRSVNTIHSQLNLATSGETPAIHLLQAARVIDDLLSRYNGSKPEGQMHAVDQETRSPTSKFLSDADTLRWKIVEYFTYRGIEAPVLDRKQEK